MEKTHKNPVVNSFLAQYPEDSWDLCIESLVNFAISTIEKKYPFGLTMQQLTALPSLFPASPQHPQKKAKKPIKSRGSHRTIISTQTLKVPVKVHKPLITEQQRSSSSKRQKSRPSPIPTPIQEPILRPYQAPQTPTPSPSQLVKLAEDFLSNPFTNYFSPESQATSSFFSVDSRFMSSIDLHSPVHSYT